MAAPQPRICAPGDFKKLTTRASAVVDENLLSRADLPLGRLLRENLLAHTRGSEKDQRNGEA
jgi:hypothetical protein